VMWNPMRSMPSITAAGGAAPAVIIAMVRPPRSHRAASGALSSMVMTMGAPT
jgi:hypothetical protein